MKPITETDSLAYRLTYARKSRNYSIAALAASSETSRSIINNIERGIVKSPKPIFISNICKVLKINKDWLLNGTGEMNAMYSSVTLEDRLNIVYDYFSEDRYKYLRESVRILSKMDKDTSELALRLLMSIADR